jgi:hypothetical protein
MLGSLVRLSSITRRMASTTSAVVALIRSHPPTQGSSLIYVFDPRKRELVVRLTPWPGSDETSVLGVSPNGVLIATSGSEIALIHTATRAILYEGASPIEVPAELHFDADGYGYCLSEGVLHRWNLNRNVLRAVARARGCRFLTEPSPGVWIVADKASVYRIRLDANAAGRAAVADRDR